MPKPLTFDDKHVSSIERLNLKERNSKWEIVEIEQSKFKLGSF